MNNLDYRGIRSTRLLTCVAASVIAVMALAVGVATFAEWGEFTKWIIGIYAGSEVAAKGAEAMRDRGDRAS